MSPSNRNITPLSLDDSHLVEARVRMFTAAARTPNGPPGQPCIEDLIADLTGPVRAEVLVRLLDLELQSRTDPPSEPDLRSRFRDDTPVLEEYFRSRPGRESSQTHPTVVPPLVPDRPSTLPTLVGSPTPTGPDNTPSPPAAAGGPLSTAFPSSSGRAESVVPSDEQLSESVITCDYKVAPLAPAADVPGGMPPRSRTPAPPIAVDGFEILGELGRGGMGVVYKARQHGLNRLVALKMILAGTAASASALERFRAEAEAVAKLKHPNIVQVYAVGEHDGQPYFALEFVDGGSLDKRLENGTLDGSEAAALMEQVARGVQHAHEHQLVHRDLKPGNILLDRTGVPKVTDFGLVKQLDAEDVHTRTGAIMGTPSYMAPEQAAGKTKEITAAADVYALGAILYELLTGQPPFKGETVYATLALVQTAEPEPPRKVRPDTPVDLETIVLKCLEKAPGRRYPSAGAMADELRRFLDGEPILARPLTRMERWGRWARRHRRALVGGTAVAVLGTVPCGVLATQWLTHRAQVAGIRVAQTAALERARAAQAAGQWQQAADEAAAALQAVGNDPNLADLREQAEAVQLAAREARDRAETDRTRAEAARADRASAVALADRFERAADEASFLAADVPGLDDPGRPARLRVAAKAALGCVVGEADGAAVWVPGLTFLPAERLAGVRVGTAELLGLLAETEPRPDRAWAVLRQGIDLGLDTADLATRQAHVLDRLERPAEADDARRRAAAAVAAEAAPDAPLERHLARLSDRYAAGRTACRAGKVAEAEPALSDVLGRRPTHVWARYYLTLCLIQRKAYADVVTQCGTLLEQRPEFVWPRLYRAFARTELARLSGDRPAQRAEVDHLRAAAAADLDQAVRRLRPPPADRLPRYAALVYRGELLTQTDRRGAAAALREAVALWPEEVVARLNLAATYQALGRPDDAATELTAAVQDHPDRPEPRRRLARLLADRGEVAKAVAEYDRVFPLAGSSTGALTEDHCMAGQLRQRLDQWPAAAAEFEAALRLTPADPTALRGCGDCAIHQVDATAKPEERTELCRRAVAAYDEVERVAPARVGADVLRRRGFAKVQLRNHAGAAQDYTRSLDLEPDADTFARRGWLVLIAEESAKRALGDFEAALKLKPDVGDWHLGRGYCLVRLGRFGDAVKEAAEGQRLGPPSAKLSYNVARIYGVAYGLVESTKALPERQQRELKERYLTSGLGAVERALEQTADADRGRFWRETVRVDPAMRPFKHTSRFRRLEATYAESGPEAPSNK